MKKILLSLFVVGMFLLSPHGLALENNKDERAPSIFSLSYGDTLPSKKYPDALHIGTVVYDYNGPYSEIFATMALTFAGEKGLCEVELTTHEKNSSILEFETMSDVVFAMLKQNGATLTRIPSPKSSRSLVYKVEDDYGIFSRTSRQSGKLREDFVRGRILLTYTNMKPTEYYYMPSSCKTEVRTERAKFLLSKMQP